MKSTLLIVAILLSTASLTMANIADPSRVGKKSLDTSLSISLDRTATEAKLIIPRSQIRQLRAELEQLDGDTDTTTAVAGNFGRTQTLVSGALLSLAFVFGGMWFVRTRPQGSKTIVAAAALLAFGSIANLVYGNAGPPPEARTITGKMFSQGMHMYKGGSGRIKLEVSDEVRNPELIVPDPKTTADE